MEYRREAIMQLGFCSLVFYNDLVDQGADNCTANIRMSIVYCCITLEENWIDIKCWLLHDLFWTIPAAQANDISTSKRISIVVVGKCKLSMLEMDLFTVDDLSALITAMKVSGKQTISMTDVASNLGRLKS